MIWQTGEKLGRMHGENVKNAVALHEHTSCTRKAKCEL